MSSEDEEKNRTLRLNQGKLESKKPENGVVRQSFSHGRGRGSGNNPGGRQLTREELTERLRALRGAAAMEEARRIESEENQRMEAEKERRRLLYGNNRPIQAIFFGPPGTGKSHKIREFVIEALSVDDDCIVETMFHPEYTHGDFIGKLMPLSLPERNGETKKVSYDFYHGDFMHALGISYRELANPSSGSVRNVLLIIDEVNRGNCSSIFGSIFQLLDRDDDGFSCYPIRVSEMERDALDKFLYYRSEKSDLADDNDYAVKIKRLLIERRIILPPNLSIVCTMNTSDESIYYMDSAFKRRWDWEYVPAGDRESCIDLGNTFIINDIGSKYADDWLWVDFVDGINKMIVEFSPSIRQVEDKQIGYRFVKPEIVNGGEKAIRLSKIRSKILFFIWDTIFPRNKTPLEALVGSELPTFNDVVKNFDIILSVVERHMRAMREKADD